jgi:hypothetical protein
MGFKPKNCLKKYYHVKPGSFIYPDENVSMTVQSTLSKFKFP